jgi:hypothetical protein
MGIDADEDILVPAIGEKRVICEKGVAGHRGGCFHRKAAAAISILGVL